MKHCYIFDYTGACIYHVELPDGIEDVESYICKTYDLKPSSIIFMVVDKPIEIIDL